MSDTTVVFYKHKVGDGLHYITDNFRVFGNGSFQLGDTSENCILFNLQLLLAHYNLPTVDEMWNRAYPGDFMADEDIAYIVFTAIDYTEEFNPASIEDVRDALADVRLMACGELADMVTDLLREKGVAV